MEAHGCQDPEPPDGKAGLEAWALSYASSESLEGACPVCFHWCCNQYHNFSGLTGHRFITSLEVRLRYGSAGLRAFCRDNICASLSSRASRGHLYLFVHDSLSLSIHLKQVE